MRTTLAVLSRFLFVVIGIILISAFVGMFTIKGIQLKWHVFIQNIVEIVSSLIFPEKLIILGPTQFEYSIFLNFWEYYLYSLTIFLSALFISFVIGLFITYFTILLPKKLIHHISKIVSLLESLPDIFIIMIIQFTVIYYLNVTGDLLFPVAGSSQTKTYFLPIVALSLVPAFMIYRINLHLVNEEWEKSNVELARSK